MYAKSLEEIPYWEANVSFTAQEMSAFAKRDGSLSYSQEPTSVS
jgi:hypothetical protein